MELGSATVHGLSDIVLVPAMGERWRRGKKAITKLPNSTPIAAIDRAHAHTLKHTFEQGTAFLVFVFRFQTVGAV